MIENNPLKNSVLKYTEFLLFISILVLGISIHKDFGITWDDPVQYNTGLVNLKYIYNFVGLQIPEKLKDFPELFDYVDRDYGVAFEVPFALFTVLCKIYDSATVYYLRHLWVFLIFWFSCVILFFTLKKYSKTILTPYLVLLLYLTTPRIFADAFYNTKDSVFLSLFTISVCTVISFLNERTYKTSLVAAAACAIATDIRIVALVLPFVAVITAFINNKKEEWIFQLIKKLLLFLCLYAIVVYLFFPFLWSNPVDNFIYVIKSMSSFRWGGAVLFNGEYHHANDMPWYYLPVYVSITLPILHLFLTFFGLIFLIVRLVLLRESDFQDRNVYLLAAFLLIFIIFVIFKRPTMYDGWRQFYFFYAEFAILQWIFIENIFNILNKRVLKLWLCFVILVLSIPNLVFMINAHPLNNVFFNVFAKRPLVDNYDVDYWGLANYGALKFINNSDNTSAVKIAPGSNTPISNQFLLLPESQKIRFVEVKFEQTPDYILDNYRSTKNHTHDYTGYEEVHTVSVSDDLILKVYKKTNE